MLVRTIITPGEWNVLINPLHPQFSLTWIVTGPDAYAFGARLVPVKKGDSIPENVSALIKRGATMPSKIVDTKWTQRRCLILSH